MLLSALVYKITARTKLFRVFRQDYSRPICLVSREWRQKMFTHFSQPAFSVRVVLLSAGLPSLFISTKMFKARSSQVQTSQYREEATETLPPQVPNPYIKQHPSAHKFCLLLLGHIFQIFTWDLAKLQCNWCYQLPTMILHYNLYLHVHLYGWKPEEINLIPHRKPLIFCFGKGMQLWTDIFFLCYSCVGRSHCSSSVVLNLWVTRPLGKTTLA